MNNFSLIIFATFIASVICGGGPICPNLPPGAMQTLFRGDCLIPDSRLYSCSGLFYIEIEPSEKGADLRVVDEREFPDNVFVRKYKPKTCQDTTLCLTWDGFLELKECEDQVRTWGFDLDYVWINDEGDTQLVDKNGKITVLKLLKSWMNA
jgi:hypothetical protein